MVWLTLRCYCQLRAMASSRNSGTPSTPVARTTTIAFYVGASMVLLSCTADPERMAIVSSERGALLIFEPVPARGHCTRHRATGQWCKSALVCR